MTNLTKNWYAIYTRSGCEKKVANMLTRKSIENYCPINRQFNGRRKAMLEPLFNSFVFVRIEDAKIPLVNKMDNVLNFVYWLGKPAVIREEEIEIMKRFVEEYINVKLEKMSFVTDTSLENISRLTKEEYIPTLISVKDNSVKIALPSLGYTMVAEVEKANVELFTPVNASYAHPDKYQFAV